MAKKLSKLDWLNHGLKVLAQDGHGALKADVMAGQLGVSRGSFYWHFKDIKTFHMEVLDQWREQSTDNVIETIDASVPPPQRLSMLLKQAFNSNAGVERALRNWGGDNAQIAEQVKAIDLQREAYISSLLELSDFAKKSARSRATILYWAYLGRLLSFDSPSFSGAVGIDELVRIFLARGD